jgi:hypothetical protein
MQAQYNNIDYFQVLFHHMQQDSKLLDYIHNVSIDDDIVDPIHTFLDHSIDDILQSDEYLVRVISEKPETNMISTTCEKMRDVVSESMMILEPCVQHDTIDEHMIWNEYIVDYWCEPHIDSIDYIVDDDHHLFNEILGCTWSPFSSNTKEMIELPNRYV